MRKAGQGASPSLLDEKTVLSHTIYFLRFALIVAVVFTHSRFVEPSTQYEGGYSLFVYLFTGVFERLPALVLFSGFLFFRSGFSIPVYGRKLKSRVRSLLVPYLFWNAAVLLFYLCLQLFLISRGETPDSKCVWEYTAHDWWMAVWGGPVARQFWFIRNLMVVMLFSPVFYVLVQYLRVCGVLLCALPWFLGVDVVLRMHTYTFFFFALGAWFALNKRNFVKDMEPYMGLSGIVFLLVAAWQVVCHLQGWRQVEWINKIGLCASVVFLIAWIGRMVGRGTLRVNVPLCQTSFFIFALHFILVGLVRKLLASFIPLSGWNCFWMHLLTAASVTLFCIGLYKLLHRLAPRFLSVITGGR